MTDNRPLEEPESKYQVYPRLSALMLGIKSIDANNSAEMVISGETGSWPALREPGTYGSRSCTLSLKLSPMLSS